MINTQGIVRLSKGSFLLYDSPKVKVVFLSTSASSNFDIDIACEVYSADYASASTITFKVPQAFLDNQIKNGTNIIDGLILLLETYLISVFSALNPEATFEQIK